MPEEINRVVTDRLARLHLTPSRTLTRICFGRVRRSRHCAVGNCMMTRCSAISSGARPASVAALGVTRGGYGLATLHRPSNVDSPSSLRVWLTPSSCDTTAPVCFPSSANADADGFTGTLHESWSVRARAVRTARYLEFLQLEDSRAS